MTRYFFHLRDESRLIEDGKGLDLPDLDAAVAEALSAARKILARFPEGGATLESKEFEICDARGRVLAELPLRKAIEGAQADAEESIGPAFFKSGPARQPARPRTGFGWLTA
jgi:hypothetical protein